MTDEIEATKTQLILQILKNIFSYLGRGDTEVQMKSPAEMIKMQKISTELLTYHHVDKQCASSSYAGINRRIFQR